MRKFLCGCQAPSRERLQGDPELTSLDTCTFDAEGFLVCVVHHQRLYGWRSLPIIDSNAGRRSDFRFAGMDLVVMEKIVEFGQVPSSDEIPHIQVKPAAEDRRDNRDPELVAEQHFLDRYGAYHPDGMGGFHRVAGMTNGHHHMPMDEILKNAKRHDLLTHGIAPGGKLMEYQRELSAAQVMSKASDELAKRTVGF